MSNQVKYFSYKEGFSLMKEALGNDKLQYTISAIAIAESIIADRLHSYLYYNNSDWLNNNTGSNGYVSTTKLSNKLSAIFRKVEVKIDSSQIKDLKTSDLFGEITAWLVSRNKVLHSMAKSEPGSPTQNVDEFKKFSHNTAIKGYHLARLISKWFNSQKKIINNLNN